MNINIIQKQNEEGVLELLFYARKEYNCIEKSNYILWFFILINYAISLVSLEQNIKMLIGAAITIGIFYIKKITNKRLSDVALAKQVIDQRIFGMSFVDCEVENKFTREAKELSIAYKKEYIEQSTNNGQDNIRGVKDWYNVDSSLSSKKQIYNCQDENIYWDRKLAIFWKNILLIFIPVIILIPIVFWIKDGKTFKDFIIYTIINISLILRVYTEISEYKKYDENNMKISFLQEIRNKIEQHDFKADILITEMQKLIFERRRLNFMVPDFVHKIKVKNLHEMWSKINN